MLSGGRVQVAGDVEQLLASHQILSGQAAAVDAIGSRFDVVHALRAEAQAYVLVRGRHPASSREGHPQPAGHLPDEWQPHPVTLKELVLGYLREPGDVKRRRILEGTRTPMLQVTLRAARPGDENALQQAVAASSRSADGPSRIHG